MGSSSGGGRGWRGTRCQEGRGPGGSAVMVEAATEAVLVEVAVVVGRGGRVGGGKGRGGRGNGGGEGGGAEVRGTVVKPVVEVVAVEEGVQAVALVWALEVSAVVISIAESEAVAGTVPVLTAIVIGKVGMP